MTEPGPGHARAGFYLDNYCVPGQVQTCREDNKIQQSLDIGSLMVTSSRIDVGPIFYMGPGPGTVVNSLFISRSNCFQITTQLDRGPGLSELVGAAA